MINPIGTALFVLAFSASVASAQTTPMAPAASGTKLPPSHPNTKNPAGLLVDSGASNAMIAAATSRVAAKDAAVKTYLADAEADLKKASELRRLAKGDKAKQAEAAQLRADAQKRKDDALAAQKVLSNCRAQLAAGNAQGSDDFLLTIKIP